MTTIPIKRALLSVSDKNGIVPFARELTKLGIEIISTGGTSKLLSESQIPHKQVEEITGLPEMLDGRVKTLHPLIHGGILGRRDLHATEAAQHQIGWIDLVVVNFYPFEKVSKQVDLSWDDAVENIDIGGPTMVRAAAKNFAWVNVVVDPVDYDMILSALRYQQGTDIETRRLLAQKAFGHTSQYDAVVHRYFMQHTQSARACPNELNLQFKKHTELRYGENPHQHACAYRFIGEEEGILSATQHQGKPLSYNNLIDSEAAICCVQEFSSPACVIVKHANPCGAAKAATIEEAFARALQADSISAFGGVVALNRPCTAKVAEAIAAIFIEVVLAPAYTPEALAILEAKTNLRVLELPHSLKSSWEMKFITGGMLLQEKDAHSLKIEDLAVVTKKAPSEEEIEAMLFGWHIAKHIKSNGILLVKNNMTIGVGAGQVSRIDAVDIAVRKAREHINESVLISDAFFPFRDGIDRIANTGVRAVIQPGGSVRDHEVIAACNEHGIAMVFTGKRCFKH